MFSQNIVSCIQNAGLLIKASYSLKQVLIAMYEYHLEMLPLSLGHHFIISF